MLAGGAGLALTGLAAPVVAQNGCSNRISRQDYVRYVELFNNNDPGFLDFYHPDVVLYLGTQPVRGAQGIRDFYAEVKLYIRETVSVDQFVSDDTGVAVIIPTVFECIKDWDDSFWGIDLKAGQKMEITSWGFYQVQDGRFTSIQSIRAAGSNGQWVSA